MPSCRPIVLTLALVSLGAPAAGEVVTMKDGRVLEGEIVAEQDTAIVLDAKVAPAIRARLTLERAAIGSIERTPLAPDFFDPPPPADRLSPADAFAPGVNLYLEVPIIGRLGTEVFADGVLAALRYAQRHRIEHLVFLLDSTGGSYEEARAIYEHLRRYDDHLTYHALVYDCLDGVLGIAIWCDTVSLLPGAAIGGTVRIDGDTPEDAPEVVMRAQIAREVAEEATRRGRRGVVIRAMIDPRQEVVGWRAADGGIETAEHAPEGLPARDMVFRAGPKETLILSYKQALWLGLPAIEGAAMALGAMLELEPWVLESDYGARVMAETAARKQREADDAAAAYAERVRVILCRRELAERYLRESLRQAAEWDPTEASYHAYARRWRWGWRDAVPRSGTGTTDADAARYFLREAARGLTALAELEREAKTLGLEPLMQPGEIEPMARDIQMKHDALAGN